MTTFTASVQYGDFKGTSAADDAHPECLSTYLEGKKMIKPGEFLIATSLWIGESHGGKVDSVGISAYLYAHQTTKFDNVKEALDAHTGPIPVRVVDLELSLEEYIRLFKRFAVTLPRRGFNLDGREYIKTN